MTPFGYPLVVYSHSKKETFFDAGYGSHPFHVFIKNNAPKARYKENAIVFDVDAYVLIIRKEEFYKNEKFHEVLDNLYDGLTEDSNPVLFFYHLNTNIGN